MAAKMPNSHSARWIVCIDSPAISASVRDWMKSAFGSMADGALNLGQRATGIAGGSYKPRRHIGGPLLRGEVHVGARLDAERRAADVADDADDFRAAVPI